MQAKTDQLQLQLIRVKTAVVELTADLATARLANDDLRDTNVILNKTIASLYERMGEVRPVEPKTMPVAITGRVKAAVTRELAVNNCTETIAESEDTDEAPTTRSKRRKTAVKTIVAKAPIKIASKSTDTKPVLQSIQPKPTFTGTFKRIIIPITEQVIAPLETPKETLPIILESIADSDESLAQIVTGDSESESESVKLGLDAMTPAATPKQLKNFVKSHGRHCSVCNCDNTPLWRKGNDAFPYLCNKCGIKWRRKTIVLE